MSVVRPHPKIGVFDRPFWDYVQNRELRLQRCFCGHLRYPPGPNCPKCLSDISSWEKVSGRGRLVSWTVFYKQYFPDLPAPYTVICGVLEEGALLVANLSNGATGSLKAEMPLRIVFEDVQTTKGDWTIYQWAM